MQELAGQIAIDRAGGRSALGLREVQHDETAVLEQDARVALEPGIADLQGVIRPDEGAVFKHRIRCRRHGLVVRPDINGPGITPDIQAHEIGAPEQDRLAGRGQRAPSRTAPAKRPRPTQSSTMAENSTPAWQVMSQPTPPSDPVQ